MQKVKKAVIPAAGLGTRFLPATKTIPKEMLTIVDRPILLYIIEEAVAAGMEDIIIVAGRGKGAIEDFFDRSYELEDTLYKAGKQDLLEKILYVRNLANIISIRQNEALGLGHAVLRARPVIGNAPFAVLLGDEIMTGSPTTTEVLAQNFQKTGKSTVAVMEVAKEDVSKYGIVDAEKISDTLYKVKNLIEKPSPHEAPSNLALPGRYVFSAKLFDFLASTKPGKNGEIQLTDAMAELAKSEGMFASTFTARRFDAGDKLGFLQANIEIALEHPELGPALKNYIKKLGQRL